MALTKVQLQRHNNPYNDIRNSSSSINKQFSINTSNKITYRIVGNYYKAFDCEFCDLAKIQVPLVFDRRTNRQYTIINFLPYCNWLLILHCISTPTYY